jgi:hypothetical protein
MSHLNGTSVDSTRPGWSEVETSTDEATAQPKRDLLDLLAQTVSEGRRDRNAIKRIATKYHQPAVNELADRVANVAIARAVSLVDHFDPA